jgi:glutathione S-transferase
MKLYSAWFCPFAQRAWLALVRQNIDFDYIEVDPYGKNEQWLNISRQAGQVPVLVLTDADGSEVTVVDSNRIVEFLDNAYPHDIGLFSTNATEQAEQKYWIDTLGSEIIPYFYRFLKTSDPGDYQDESHNKMIQGMTAFTRAMSSDGPYFSGDTFGAVDIAFIPFAYRINLLLSHYRGFRIPVQGGLWERYQRWYESCIALPAFQATMTRDDEQLIEFYLVYSQGGGQADVTEV